MLPVHVFSFLENSSIQNPAARRSNLENELKPNLLIRKRRRQIEVRKRSSQWVYQISD